MVSQLETHMIPRNMIKYFCFFFRLFVHFAIVVSKIAFKPSVTQSMLFDVPQGCLGWPHLFLVDYCKAKGIIFPLHALQTAQIALYSTKNSRTSHCN